MGTIYCGPHTDQIGCYDQEGYAARIRTDGTETGTWTFETREFRGYRAHCDCGWRCKSVHPATDAGELSAMDEWDRDHLRPLIDAEAKRHTIRADVLLAFIRELYGSVRLANYDHDRPVFTEHSRGLVSAAERLGHLLDELARQEPRGRHT